MTVAPIEDSIIKNRVLIAEDDFKVSQLMVELLQRSGFTARVVDNGDDVLPLINSGNFDLLLLDILLPGRSGLEVLRELRKLSQIPVIILSALATEKDRITGLKVGANDYVVKPYYPKELLVRIQKMLLESPPIQKKQSNLIITGTLIADLTQKKITMDGVVLGLTGLEFDLLLLLLRNMGHAVDRQTLSMKIYNDEQSASTRKIDMKINHIRKKLGHRSEMIRTVWNVGYELIPMEQD